MVQDISNWISLVSAVTAFISYLEAKKATAKNSDIEVLRKIIEAANETESYLTLRAEGQERDRSKENHLANLWAETSFLMIRIDRNLSLRLSDKSKFWRDPQTWEAQQTSSGDISLSSVRNDAEKLLLAFA
jgi:hypothetical protein